MEITNTAAGFFAQEITPQVFARINGVSYRENPHITPAQLRHLTVLHTGFDGETHTGELIVNAEVADDVLAIFKALYENRYPIEQIRLIDDYGADDERSMTANNSSAFCYRCIAHTATLSLHSLGLAVDINPLYNPYLARGFVMPAAAKDYVDRSQDFPHKITHDDLCFQLFAAHGWLWGGDWTDEKDYQHFYKPLVP
ncbi:MAG: M15 family metallopeptidase [Oscillospiraceae bacterium]